ncbi:MAG: TIGR03862 family flavoprotein [Rhodoferax sp.]|nr:MAG: TIGR03862 family flavoprotein [Rhodoferax sp.]
MLAMVNEDKKNMLEVDVAVVGAGPAGLMAAQLLSTHGVAVHVFDAMPSVGRKFLLAGKGGLNLTHAEPLDAFITRYGTASAALEPLLRAFGPQQLRDWALDLGVETFVGTSQRVFPTDMKAAPLLRSWLARLRHPTEQGGVPVQFHMRQRWLGWTDDGALRFQGEDGGHQHVKARAVLLALGGGSWARLGSDGAWVAPLAQAGVALAPLQPSNCGFEVAGGWTPLFRDKFAGQAFKSVAIRCTDSLGHSFARKGEFVATAHGIEGSLIYAASSLLRDEIARSGSATLLLDLLPDFSEARVLQELAHPRGSRSLSSHLKSRLHLEGIKTALLYELLSKAQLVDPAQLAAAIKAMPIRLAATRPLDEAISTAGGVRWDVVTPQLMLQAKPGVFVAGEMLDWEAPTGGYLLTACMATGWHAGQGVRAFLQAK